MLVHQCNFTSVVPGGLWWENVTRGREFLLGFLPGLREPGVKPSAEAHSWPMRGGARVMPVCQQIAQADETLGVL